VPDWEAVEKELRGRGMTLSIIDQASSARRRSLLLACRAQT
jgi:hypothetical protein